MRRPLALAAAVLAVLAGVTGCSPAPAEPLAAPPATNPLGDPSDTASPLDTSRPTPPDFLEDEPTPTVAPTVEPIDPASSRLAACLVGNWSAPVTREFAALGFSQRSRGTVREGVGVLLLTVGGDRSFVFTYSDVELSLALGHTNLRGPVTGSWSLAGNTWRADPAKNDVKVTYSFGPVTVSAPRVVSGALRNLPPPQSRVTCTDMKLLMRLPAGQGGEVVFDRV